MTNHQTDKRTPLQASKQATSYNPGPVLSNPPFPPSTACLPISREYPTTEDVMLSDERGGVGEKAKRKHISRDKRARKQ
jgi:hypothetical protein